MAMPASPIPEAGLVVSRRVEGDVHRLAPAQLAARIRRLAGALATAGLGPGQRVASLAWNGHRHLELCHAAAEIGAELHPLDPRQHPDHLARHLDRIEARALFFDLSFLPLVEAVAIQVTTARTFVLMTDRSRQPVKTRVPELQCYEDWLEAAQEAAQDGTPHAAPSPCGDRVNQTSEVLLLVQPMASATWDPCARLVLPGPFLDGQSLHALIEREGVTVAIGPACAWQALLTHVEVHGLRLDPLQRLVTRPGLCPAALEAVFRTRYGVHMQPPADTRST